MAYKKKDSFHKLAKESGYRSRAAFKLLEIQKKFRIINKGDSVLDLGAAPGSWIQVALKLRARKAIGIDTEPISDFDNKNVEILSEDIYDLEINQNFDVVLADLAPKTSGIRQRDQGLSYALSGQSLFIAKKHLKKDGNFVTKCLEGGETEQLFQNMKELFHSVKKFRPKATRKSSKEVYLIGLGFM